MSQRPEDLIRRLGRRFGAVLLVVAGLLVADQAILQPLLVRLNLSAPVINLAGRQRMLSQRIVKDALTIALTPATSGAIEQQLAATVEEWRHVHAGLRFGDPELRLTATIDPEIIRALDATEGDIASMSSAVARIIERPADSSSAIRELLASEQAFLPEMDQIVRLYEQDAQTQVDRLRRTGLIAAAVILALLCGLQWLVLRPAIALIRTQVDDLSAHERELMDARDQLELRVGERTRQLSETNAALAAASLEQAAAEQRMLQLQSQLAQAARVNSLGELATGIAHEVNQPLGAITNLAETLLLLQARENHDPKAIAHTTMRIRDAAHRAGQIIRRMRNFVWSRVESRSSEEINPLITEVLALCDAELSENNVNVRLNGESTVGVEVLVDPIQIQQVLVNVVRNAAQAMAGVPVNRRELMIDTVLDEEALSIIVEDTGPGFPGDPAQSPVPWNSTKADGMGLGLSISRSILAAHGGALSAENTHSGARVTITLPCPETSQRREHADRLCCR